MSYSHVDNKGIPLQNKLNEIINKKNGFFIELGAYDGLFQSNTAFFEKELGWTGLLIEPSFKGYELCKINRPNSVCYNCACVSNDYVEEFVYGDFGDINPMASINGSRLSNNEVIKVKAITLEQILDEHNCTNIDLLSLDTEGYELEILKGLNLDRYRPKYMLIELYTNDYNNTVNYLNSNNYKLHSNFTNYNKIDNPGWDGTHNDFLFIDNNHI